MQSELAVGVSSCLLVLNKSVVGGKTQRKNSHLLSDEYARHCDERFKVLNLI